MQPRAFCSISYQYQSTSDEWVTEMSVSAKSGNITPCLWSSLLSKTPILNILCFIRGMKPTLLSFFLICSLSPILQHSQHIIQSPIMALFLRISASLLSFGRHGSRLHCTMSGLPEIQFTSVRAKLFNLLSSLDLHLWDRPSLQHLQKKITR